MRRTGPVQITERDRKVMKFAFEQRAISYDQIRCRLFESTKRPTVQYRLGRLVRDGYLSKIGIPSGGSLELIYGLTEKGFNVVRKDYRFEITQAYFKSDSYLHDVALTDIRTRLEKSAMFEDYISENMLQACGELTTSLEYGPFGTVNSDAVLVLRGQEKSFRLALEFEASEKSGVRYGKKLTEYYFSHDIVAALYVCGDARIEKSIRRVDSEFESQFEPKIYTCTMDVVRSGASPLPFTNRKNATFLLR